MQKNQPRNIILVGSPLQLLCSLEAILYFEIKSYDLIIRTSDSANGKQISKLLEIFKINKFYEIKREGYSTFFQYVDLYRRLKKNKYEKVFIGENGTAFRSFVFSLHPEKIYLLDDGVATIEERQYNEFPTLRQLWKRKYGKIRNYRYFIYGMRMSSDVKISYFSSIIEKRINNEDLISHKFERLKAKIREMDYNADPVNLAGEVLFVDTAHVEGEFLSKEELFAVWKKAIRIVGHDKNITYRPHRSQKKDLIDELASRLNLKISISDTPIELDIINLRGLSLVIGTFTTALINIKILKPNLRVVALDVRRNIINSGRHGVNELPQLKSIYERFSEVGIEVVD